MNQSDVLGNIATFGGTLGTCVAAPAAYTYESQMLLFLSALGTFTAIAGLTYTIWNGNRQYKLAMQKQQLELEQMRIASAHLHSTHQEVFDAAS